MLAHELISTILPVLHPEDTSDDALRLMNEYHVSQLPLLSGKKYVGLLTEEALLDLEASILLKDLVNPGIYKPAIVESAAIFDVLKVFADQKLCVLPVIAKDETYVGLIPAPNLIAGLSLLNGVQEPGGLVVLEVGQRDYSLSEIARIAESNDVSLLSVNTMTDPLSGKMDVILKTNRQDISRLVATFERFNYHIKYLFTQEMEEDVVRKNYDLFMNYISM
jgi:acetoin utilization protein AcuB